MHQFLGIALAIGLNILHMGYTYGVVMTKITYLEKASDTAKVTDGDVKGVTVKVATVEAKLSAISDQLARIERALEKR